MAVDDALYIWEGLVDLRTRSARYINNVPFCQNSACGQREGRRWYTCEWINRSRNPPGTLAPVTEELKVSWRAVALSIAYLFEGLFHINFLFIVSQNYSIRDDILRGSECRC